MLVKVRKVLRGVIAVTRHYASCYGDLGGLCLILNRPLPEAQVPPQLGGARPDPWQLLEEAPGRAADRALIGLPLPGLLPRAVHLLVCPAERRPI